MNIPDEQLQELSDLASQQLKLEGTIESLEQQLEDAKSKHRTISEQLIPEAMMSVGMESFKLSDGTSVKIEKFYSGNITGENQHAAFSWLRETGNGSLIKREVKCQFGKGEDEKAAAAIAILRTAGYVPTDKESVHPMTLKSFIREQVESGAQNFPMELFGAYVGNKTKIAPAKR